MAGSVTSARATATRCCWPPDSSLGRWSARSVRPTVASAAMARSRRSARRTPAYTSGSSTLRQAGSVASRLNCWNTKPMKRLRTSASWSSSSERTSWPARRNVPLVGTSRQPRMFISVDLPEPDGPVTATNSLRRMVIETSRRAATSSGPVR